MDKKLRVLKFTDDFKRNTETMKRNLSVMLKITIRSVSTDGMTPITIKGTIKTPIMVPQALPAKSS